MKSSGWMQKTGIICFWLALWQLTSMAVHHSILLVGPATVAAALFRMLPTVEFWKTITLSFSKISIGFLSAAFAGMLAGCTACRFPFIEGLLNPVIVLLKSVPVASFVILALIWVGSKNLSILIAFLIVFPMIYANTIAGWNSAEPQLLEMAWVFRMSEWKKFRCIYWPALLPYLTTGVNISLGISIKSGIAAEVIGVPDHSIGEKLYMAKIYLDTGSLFAWTLVIIAISGLFEKAIIGLLKTAEQRYLAGRKQNV